jgi:hypothetical protein
MAHSIGPERHSVAPPASESSRALVQEDFLFHLYRGSELLQENRVLEAKEELEFALTVQPLDAKGQDLLGTVYFRLGLYPRAIQIYEALEPQFPRDTSIKINLALAYLKTGQAEPARRVLKDAVTLQPDHKRAWGYLGLALQKLGELDQAQVAFERGGHTLMARRVGEKRRQSLAPLAPPPSIPPEPGVGEGVRAAAEAAFSELDAGELKFSLARPEQPKPGDAWHPVEPGTVPASLSPLIKTMPPSAAAVAMQSIHESVTVPPPSAIPAPPVAPVPPVVEVPVVRVDEPSPRPARLPAPLALPIGRSIGLTGGGVLLVRTSTEASGTVAGRLEAVRIVAVGGSTTTRVLHRRRDDADLNEILGGIGSPVVQFTGEGQIALGARPGYAISLLAIENDAASVLEDRLLAFQLSLAYDCARAVFEYPGERARSAPEGSPIVQLRGTGSFALEVAGSVSSVPSVDGQTLLVRREWIVGWLGRLAVHALSPAEAPGGQRGLVGFAGEGTVLVCVG